MEYVILLEKTNTGYSAHSPDIEGCVAVGETREETIRLMKEALEFHIKNLKRDGEPIPEASSIAASIDLAI